MSLSDIQTHPTHVEIAKRVGQIRRAMGGVAASIVSSRQKATGQDPGVKGPIWVSKLVYPKPPENSLQDIIVEAIDELGDGTEKFDEPEALGNEREKYTGLMKEVTNKLTIFYVWGGAFM